MFRYHEDGSKKLNSCRLFFFCAWFIFNLKTKSRYSQLVYYGIYTSDEIHSNPTPLPLITHYFTYLENQLSCLWCEYPSILVHPSTLAINCPPFAASSHPSTSHRSSYNIYIDDINIISRPRLTQFILPLSSLFCFFIIFLSFSLSLLIFLPLA
jgi:hypothetical protein